ncbi:MAG TPA: hypothetical protein VM784_09650 [Actinomycetota bacterium]|nr:hypothetical protein [Actinomycetota bacterium]
MPQRDYGDRTRLRWQRLRSLIEAGDLISGGYQRASSPVRAIYWTLALCLCGFILCGASKLGVDLPWIRLASALVQSTNVRSAGA